MGGASTSNSLSFYNQQSLPRVPPPLPTLSLVEQQRQSPSFIIEAATSYTGPSSSTPEQQYSTISPQQQGPLLQINQYSNYLPLSEIPTHQLRICDDVIAQHRKLINDDCVGTLCQILAKEAIFGKDVMERCTVTGRGGTHALPFQPMNDLKAKMFQLLPRYHSAPEQFEPVWKKCMVAIEQACGRLRRDKEKTSVKTHTRYHHYLYLHLYIT